MSLASMSLKSRYTLSAAALLASTGLACAADLPVRTPPPSPIDIVAPTLASSWTGFYVGANFGYGAALGVGSISSIRIENGAPTPLAEPFHLPGPRPRGVLGGLQAGYNHQIGRFVFGAETDIQLSGLRGFSRGTGPVIPGHNFALDAQATQSVDWFGTVRARVGTTLFNPRFLVYATGGLAYGGVRYGQDFLDSDADVGLARHRATRVGWTAGAGAEWALADRWSLKLEYLYTDLGRGPKLMIAEITPGIIAQPDVHKTFDTNPARFHTIRAGLNYRFDLFNRPAPLTRH